MNYAAVAQHRDHTILVTAVVTAGVQGNATCAGDPATWRETETGWEKVPTVGGTINTVLLVNHSLTEGALARAVITMTEAKTAALQQLAIAVSTQKISRPEPAPINSASALRLMQVSG